MANVLVEEQSMTNIANELRKKLGTLLGFKPSEMADAIDDIDESVSSNKKIGQIQTTMIESDFNIEADDQTPGSQLLPQAFDRNKAYSASEYGTLLSKIKSIIFPVTTMIAPENMQREFYQLPNVTSINFNALDLSNVITMYNMCSGCTNLESFDFGFSTANKITTLSYVFYNCSKLTEVKFNNLNLNNVTNFSFMFYNCQALSSTDLEVADIIFDGNLSNMFYGCSALTVLNLGNIVFRDVTNMSAMFKNCTSLQSVTLPETCNYIYMVNTSNGLFQGCTALQSLRLLSTTPPTFNNNNYAKCLFSGSANAYNEGMKIYVPEGCRDVYREADGWSNFADIIFESM